jgi:hypothetical protein
MIYSPLHRPHEKYPQVPRAIDGTGSAGDNQVEKLKKCGRSMPAMPA